MKCTNDKGCGENPCICTKAIFCVECDNELTLKDIENGEVVCENCEMQPEFGGGILTL